MESLPNSVTQGQFISNGALPSAGVLESVVSSIIGAADQEIALRGWGSRQEITPSPKIPDGGNAREVYAALFDAQNVILLAPRRCVTESAPPMHIHALREPELVSALKSIGAHERMLGDKLMQTATLDLRKAAEKHEGPARPLTLISPDAARHNPLFSLVA